MQIADAELPVPKRSCVLVTLTRLAYVPNARELHKATHEFIAYRVRVRSRRGSFQYWTVYYCL